MRARPRLDNNHHDIVDALEAAGASVQSLASVGCGCLDLLVGIRGATTVMEIKNAKQPPSKRRLTADEQKWYDNWRGSKFVVETPEQALKALATL